MLAPLRLLCLDLGGFTLLFPASAGSADRVTSCGFCSVPVVDGLTGSRRCLLSGPPLCPTAPGLLGRAQTPLHPERPTWDSAVRPCSRSLTVLGQQSRRDGGPDPMEEEGEAGALCVTAVCLQGGELGRHCLVQPPLLAVRRCCLPLLLRGKPPSSASVPATEPTARIWNGFVDSMGASSGPLSHSGGRWPGCGVSPLPVSPLPAAGPGVFSTAAWTAPWPQRRPASARA